MRSRGAQLTALVPRIVYGMAKRGPRLVSLGYGKFVRADPIFVLVPLDASERGERARVERMPPLDDRAPALNRFLPIYDCGEVHERIVAADPQSCDRAFRELTGAEVRTLGPLMWLRALPKRLSRRRRGAGAKPQTQSLVDEFLAGGFTVLLDQPAEQVAAGAIGRWWSPAGNAPLDIDGAEAFLAFDSPGYAKAAISFEFIPVESGTRIRTETRIAGTDPSARRRFGAYWVLVRLPSGLVRRSWLAAIERRALQRVDA